MDDRTQFLLKMYEQVWGNINRQINLTWQGIGVVLSSLALFSLSQNGMLSLDVSCSLVLCICAWLVAQVLDSNEWFNRNQVIITNIERQFLVQSDGRNIHYFFLPPHRKAKSILSNFKIQISLAICVSFISIIYHFSERILPGILNPGKLEIMRSLPYLLVIAFAALLVLFYKYVTKRQQQLLDQSPGIEIDAQDSSSSSGHPVEN